MFLLVLRHANDYLLESFGSEKLTGLLPYNAKVSTKQLAQQVYNLKPSQIMYQKRE